MKARVLTVEKTLAEETLKWTMRIDQMEERVVKAEEDRNAAEVMIVPNINDDHVGESESSRR